MSSAMSITFAVDDVTPAASPLATDDLAARPDQLIDPRHLAAPLMADDALMAAPGLGSRVSLSELDGAMPALLELVAQAQQLADLAG